MDTQVLYLIFGIVVFVIIIILVLRSKEVKVSRTQAEKKEDIVLKYKQKLRDSLIGLEDDKDARVAKKRELLKQISHELALNIFFDKDEIREVILDLSRES